MKRTGIGLAELLIAIPLIGVVSWVLSGVFLSALREMPALHRMTQVHVSLSSFVDHLQRDADSASSLDWAGTSTPAATADGNITLATASGPVVYHIAPGRAERVAGSPARVADRWEMPASHIEVAVVDGAVCLTTAVDERGRQGQQRHLVLRRLIRPAALGAKEAAK
jgi:hypothetical protein